MFTQFSYRSLWTLVQSRFQASEIYLPTPISAQLKKETLELRRQDSSPHSKQCDETRSLLRISFVLVRMVNYLQQNQLLTVLQITKYVLINQK